MTVIVYTQPNCQPCAAVKRLLMAEGIPFEERSAAEHRDYLASIGARSVPVIVDGDQVIHGFIPDQLRALNQ
ncbi:glutaredoxin family protein [Paracoccus kondratievae]|uniref:Glutaredoxin domain-containing protein n=1 Tax=Paracoccus kondratievae TaxID=135740 RepID=A0AAD3NX99_9RHOB|nr:glutaredoxin family protein [Paracoccus kondratievae]AZV00260.1 NrdH-redoxin [Paracoccus phage vB_PkoS_Pkon1]GLK63489.1 hypothetical protein GCM10017635_09590 [Paracoccus kondratievae]